MAWIERNLLFHFSLKVLRAVFIFLFCYYKYYKEYSSLYIYAEARMHISRNWTAMVSTVWFLVGMLNSSLERLQVYVHFWSVCLSTRSLRPSPTVDFIRLLNIYILNGDK